MKKQLLIVLASVFMLCQAQAQTDKLWAPHKGGVLTMSKDVKRLSFPTDFKLYELNINSLKQNLASAQDRFASNKKGVIISLPNTDGKLEKFELYEASNFEPGLQERFPEIRSYVGKSLSDAYAQLRLSISPKGIQTMVFRAGKETEFMEPYSEDGRVYAVYNSARKKGSIPFECSTKEDNTLAQNIINQGQTLRSNNQIWKTMRLALSCTAEYATYHGGTVAGALAAFNNTMTRVNGVLEKDLALHLNIINNTTIIYTNAGTDPYDAAATGLTDIAGCTSATNDCPGTWNTQLQSTLTTVVGEANYDIGHLFGASGGGGNAGCIGCVCNALRTSNSTPTYQRGKGEGITSPADNIPAGDNFDIDYVAHELGHQLGGNHTFSFSTENNAVNVEPGSGSTIMAYAGITGATDVQAHSDDYYTYRSILQIQTNLATKTCPVSTTITNNPPTVNAGAALTLPKGTPFTLTGTGSDINGDTVTYCWEQNDDATTVGAAASYPSGTKTNGPNFRSYDPVATPVRTFPSLSNLANNTTTWEVVPTIARTLNFTLTGRDNAVGAYQTSTSSVAVTFSATVGPFAVTSQNVTDQTWMQGSSQTIIWTVNSTTTLTGSTNVDILLSTDGGLTYPTVLLANTTNDGTQVITVPNVSSQNCRVMVKPTGNVYFAINSKPIAIGYTVVSTCNNYTLIPTDTVIPDDDTVYKTDALTVPTTANISDVNLAVNLTHTWISDMTVTVLSPLGTQVNVFSRSCTTNDNINATFDDQGSAIACALTITGNVIPAQPLSALNGQNPNGTWTFGVIDTGTGDTGNINSYTLTVCSTAYTLSNAEFEFADFSLFPNPNSGNFNVKFTSDSSNDIKINVHDMRGRQVYEKSFSNTGVFNQNVTLNKVEAGIYLVSIIDGAKKTVKRIVIE